MLYGELQRPVPVKIVICTIRLFLREEVEEGIKTWCYFIRNGALWRENLREALMGNALCYPIALFSCPSAFHASLSF